MADTEQDTPGAKFVANLVPKHYTINATLTQRGMYDLVVALRQYVREFDASDVIVELLEELEETYEGDLPTPPLPVMETDDDDAPAAA